MANLPALLTVQKISGKGVCSGQPLFILSAFSFCLLGPLELAVGKAEAGVHGHTQLDTDCSPGSDHLSLHQRSMHATTFRYFSLTSGPLATATHTPWGTTDSLTCTTPPGPGHRVRGATSAWTKTLPEVT